MSRSCAFAAGLLFIATLSSAQANSHCVLPVSILDADSQAVTHPEVTDIELRIGDGSVPLLSIRREVPNHVVLFLDSSRQMSGNNVQRNRQLLLLYWLAASAPEQVNLVAYTGKIEAVIEGKAKVLSELKARGSKDELLGGESAYMSALLRTATALKARPGDAMFIIAPGFMPTRSSDRAELLRLLQSKGIRLFYMQFSFPTYSLGGRAPVSELGREAAQSGGAGFVWPEEFGNKSTIEQLRDRLLNQMYRYYLLQFDLPAGVPPGAGLTLRHKSSGTALLYPSLAVCSPPSTSH